MEGEKNLQGQQMWKRKCTYIVGLKPPAQQPPQTHYTQTWKKLLEELGKKEPRPPHPPSKKHTAGTCMGNLWDIRGTTLKAGGGREAGSGKKEA